MKSSLSTSEIRTNLESDIKMPSGLDLLASVAAYNDDKLLNTEECSTSTNDSTGVSPVLKHIHLTFPRVDKSKKEKEFQFSPPSQII